MGKAATVKGRTAEIEERFNSLGEFIDYATQPAHVDRPRNADTLRAGRSFYGVESWDEAVQMAHGWHDGVKKFTALRAQFNPSNQRNRKVARSSVAGPGVVNMGRFMAGHPEAYTVLADSQQTRKGKGKIVRLEVNLFVSGGVDKSTIERRGGIVVALADAFERAGRRVEIYGNVCVKGSMRTKKRMNFRIRIKAAHQKLNLASLAFVMAHPAMYRVIGFAALEVHPEGEQFGAHSFYGYPGTATVEPGAIEMPTLSYANAALRSDETAAAFIRQTLTEQGVTMKG